MKTINNKSGFTLIEIIVVLIIVGILAAIALPNLFANIQKSKGAEAVASFGPMKASIEGCGQKNQSYAFAACNPTGVGTQNNFTYYFGSACTAGALKSDGTGVGAADTYCMEAINPTGSAAVTPPGAGNYITLYQATLGGQAVCTGYGTFAGVC